MRKTEFENKIRNAENKIRNAEKSKLSRHFRFAFRASAFPYRITTTAAFNVLHSNKPAGLSTITES